MPYIKGTDSEGRTLWLDQRGYWQLSPACAEKFANLEASQRRYNICLRNRSLEDAERVIPEIVENLRG